MLHMQAPEQASEDGIIDMETFNQLLEMCVFPNLCLCPFLYPISPLEKIASATLEVVLVWTNSVGAFGHRAEEDIPCGVVRVPCLGRQCDLSLPVALEYRFCQGDRIPRLFSAGLLPYIVSRARVIIQKKADVIYLPPPITLVH